VIYPAVSAIINRNGLLQRKLVFDKAIVTNFKHSAKYKDIYPGVVDGWYEPATGGIFYYGIQAGYSMTKHDVYLRGGNVLNQDFKTKPFTPFYAEIGYNYKLN
jgi:hypothetical protein